MDPIPEKLKHLATDCTFTELENGNVQRLPDFSNIIMYKADKGVTQNYHPLCCFLRVKFYHHAERYTCSKIYFFTN